MIEIRKAFSIELPLLVPLFNEYRTFYKQRSDLEGAKLFLGNRIKNDESVIFISVDVSAESEKGVGFVQLYPIFSSVSMQRVWLLNDLFISPDYRRRGIADSLMEAAVEMARSDGAKGLMLETGIENTEAQKLYEKLGWVRTKDYYMYTLTFN